MPQGTVTTLSRHTGTRDEAHVSVKRVITDLMQNKIIGYVKTNVIPIARDSVRQNKIYMIAHDSQTFSVVENRGFKQLAKTLVATNAKYGNINVDSILYDRTSV